MPSMLRVLAVTNMWPYEDDRSYGGFVQEQMESLRPLGVDYDPFFINGRASRSNYLSGIWKLRRQLTGNRYDLVHAHFGLSGCVARIQARVPLVVTFHGDDVLGRPDRSGRITVLGRMFQVSSFLLARCARAVIVQSQEMKRKLRLESAEVIPCGVDLSLFRPMPQPGARHVLGLGLHKKYVLFPYNPSEPRKRFDLVEGAVRLAAREIPGLEVLRVQGRLHTEMPLYMNAADVLVMASLIEGSPVAVKEAMAVNLPVVSVRVGDTAELLGNAEGCHLVARDAGAIAEKIIHVCRRPERTRTRDSMPPLSIESVARRIADVYARVLRCRRTASNEFP